MALPLAYELKRFGLTVWLDRFELKVGDNLVAKIDEGLSAALRGVVILSESFFAKAWTNREYQGLVAKEMGGGPSVIPVRHGVTNEDVLQASPPLAALYAAETSRMSISTIAFQIAEVVRPDLVQKQGGTTARGGNGPVIQVPLRNLERGPVLHTELDPSLLDRATIIHHVFHGLLTRDLSETLEDFRREEDPEEEIRLWESMAAFFLGSAPSHLDDRRRRAVAYALLAASLGSRDQVIHYLDPFPHDEAEALAREINRAVLGYPLVITRNDQRIDQD